MSEEFNRKRLEAESLYAEKQWAKAEQMFAALMAESESRGEPANGDIIHDHAGLRVSTGPNQGGPAGI